MSDPLERFKRLNEQLNKIEDRDGPEADSIRDKMDQPWREMSKEEREEARRHSMELNRVSGLKTPPEPDVKLDKWKIIDYVQAGMLARHKTWRGGQAIYNAIALVCPDLADQIRGGDLDPFYDNNKIRPCLDWLRKNT